MVKFKLYTIFYPKMQIFIFVITTGILLYQYEKLINTDRLFIDHKQINYVIIIQVCETPEVYEILVGAGADPAATNTAGLGIFEIAVENESEDLINYLVSRGLGDSNISFAFANSRVNDSILENNDESNEDEEVDDEEMDEVFDSDSMVKEINDQP